MPGQKSLTTPRVNGRDFCLGKSRTRQPDEKRSAILATLPADSKQKRPERFEVASIGTIYDRPAYDRPTEPCRAA